jgi:hypothetical protein
MLISIILSMFVLAVHTLDLPSSKRWIDCTAKTSFYVCQNNGFTGCCSVDPCALPACPDTTPPSFPAITKSVCTPGKHKLFQPSMHALFPESPDQASPPTTDIALSQAAGPDLVTQQLVTFSGIPSAAKDCQLDWAVPSERTFIVVGSGLVDVFAIDSAVADPVTWNSVQAAGETRIGSGDFTFWPGVPGAQDLHIVGGVGCKETLAFRMGVDGVLKGSVDLVQGAEAGWYLQYEC